MDRIDLSVASGDVVSICDSLAAGSVVGEVVVGGVVGDWLLASTADIDGVDLGVGSFVALVSDALAAG